MPKLKSNSIRFANLVIPLLAALIAGIYVCLNIWAVPSTGSDEKSGVDSLIRAIALDKNRDFGSAQKALEGYFASSGALLPPHEVAKVRYFRATVEQPDYFDMLVCTRNASVWPNKEPVRIYIDNFKSFGEEADTIIHAQIDSALKEWQISTDARLQFKRVMEPDRAQIKIVPELDPSFMPLKGALADTSWIEDDRASKNSLLPKRQSATIRIIDPKLEKHPSQRRILSIRSSILHELGHALGINGHSANTADTMFAIENASSQSLAGKEYTLSERDRKTIQKLYDKDAESNALARIESLASQNDAYACHALAISCYRGEGKQKDEAQAFKWAQKAADQNLPEAISLVAEMYLSGKGRTKNLEKAFALFKKAADLNSPDANINLGFMYANGLGVKKDYEKSSQCYEVASKRGLATATFNLGVNHENGTGTEKDYAKAMEYYRRAASQGSALALSAMSAMYYTGRGVERDYTKGIELANRAAEQSADGKAKVGDLYFYGLGVPVDYAKALAWYQKGAKENSGSALLRLAGMHVWGRGVKQDVSKAKEYYRQAEDLGLDSARQGITNLDFDDAVGEMMRGQYQAAAQAVDRFLATARKSYYEELENNFYYAATYANIAWRHAGRPDKAQQVCKTILKEHKLQKWPREAVQYLCGEITEKELLAVAGDDLEKLTESKYFIGANEAVDKKYSPARANLEWVLKEGRRDFFEYSFAEAELNLLPKH